jgi:hypothetical protein
MKKTSRRTFGKELTGAIAALPLMHMVVGAQKRKPKRSGGQVRIRQSSPITVGGGGSVGLDFDETYYKNIPNTNKFVSTNGDKIHKLWIIDKHGTMVDCPLPQANCTITIHSKEPGGPDSALTINGSPLGVEFVKSEYPLEYPEQGSDKKIHLNKKRKITDRIEIRDNGSGVTTYCKVPTGGSCTIIAVNTL